MNLAPTIAGFSEAACNMYSGTYCENPIGCSGLVECVAAEKEWAATNNRIAFELYLNSAPEVSDSTNGDECAELREYLVSYVHGWDCTTPTAQTAKPNEQCISFRRATKEVCLKDLGWDYLPFCVLCDLSFLVHSNRLCI